MRTAKNELERFAPATAQKNINLEVLSIVAVPLPPLEEQQRIVAKIDRYFAAAEAVEKMLTANNEQIQKLNQSILAKAFRGELVPQDPNDEPASVLLERIRVERAKREAEAKAAKKSRGNTTGQRSRKAKQQDSESIQMELPGLE